MRTQLLAIAGAATLAAACHRNDAGGGAPPAMPPVPVTVELAAARDIPVPLEYLGRTEGAREVEIRARVGGYLESRHYDEGAMVAAGDLLFRIDPKPLQAQAASARADVATARAEVEQAEREAARLEPLLAEDAVTQKERDDAVSLARITRARLLAAEARLQQIELDLSYTDVTAPIAGKTGRALRDEGSLLAPGDDLLTTLLQLDPIHVLFQRTENQQFAFDRDLQSGRMALPDGGALAVEVRHRDGTLLADGGAIDFTAGRIDESTATIPMRAVLPNPDLRLRAGQAVRVVLRGAVLRNAIAVPQRAVVESTQGKIVWVVEDGKDGGLVAAQRPVEPGEWVLLDDTGPAARGWVIKSGIAAGDRVIVDNLIKLRPGGPVQIAPAGAAPAPTNGGGAAHDVDEGR
ncbi:MAG: efflux RND transporter periplasmic adaptor subunit [Planctomycetota bacterium]